MSTNWTIIGRSTMFFQGAGRVVFHLRRVFYTPKGVSGAENTTCFRHELKKYGIRGCVSTERIEL